MSINFPQNPLHGQQYAASGIPITWQFDSGRNAWRVVRTGTAWMDIVGKPSEFPPSDHEHPIDEVTGLQSILDVKQDISARTQPNGYPSLDSDGRVPANQLPFGLSGDWDDITNKPAEFPPSPHTHPVAQISDSSSTGQQIVRAPTGADVLNIIGGINQDGNARVSVKKNSGLIGVRRNLNLIEGSNVTMTVADDPAQEEVEITINASGSGGGTSLTVSEIKPAAPSAGMMWLDVATGIEFVYYNDGNTSQWIEALPYLETMPGTFTKFDFPPAPIEGQLYNPIPGATWKWSNTRGVWFAVSTSSGSYTKAEADTKFVDIVGDVMTGPLSVIHPPTANAHAASKQYVDSLTSFTPSGGISSPTVAGAIAELDAEKVAKAGDTMTGPLVLPADPASAMQAATKQYVDSRPTLTVSSTPPVGALDGALWWEDDTGQLYVRYNDGNTTQWVVAVPQPDTSTFLTKTQQGLSAAEQTQVRSNISAAPFDALGWSGIQINGGFEISQEKGTAVTTTVTNDYICDGWLLFTNGTAVVSAGVGSPGPPNFAGMLAVNVPTAQTTMGASNFYTVSQVIEGKRIARLGWGLGSAQPLTIGFWSAHKRAGVYGGSVRNDPFTRSYPFTYTQNVAWTWQYNVVTIPGCVDGVWAIDNTAGIILNFTLACGSSFIAPAIGWSTTNYLSGPGQVNGVAATTDQFLMTGVTVLPGIQAPTAAQSQNIIRHYDQELLTCMRYYELDSGQIVIQSPAPGTMISLHCYKVVKRAGPTITFTNVTGSGSTVTNSITAHMVALQLTAPTAGAYSAFNLTISARL